MNCTEIAMGMRVDKVAHSPLVIAGLVPAISLRRAWCFD